MSGFPYDVAFSFLSQDLGTAKELSALLEPGLSTFVYVRHKEELLGGDGMDEFARVFGREARLAVILFRDGYGRTPWTAFEESHIKSRALASKMKSFFLVRLDDSETPAWIPEYHLYSSVSTESAQEICGAVKARARQEGAVVRQASTAELAVRTKKRADERRERAQHQESFQAVGEVQAEVELLFGELRKLVEEMRTADPTLTTQAGTNATECVVADKEGSTCVAWLQPINNNLRNARLHITDYRGRIGVPANPLAAVTYSATQFLGDPIAFAPTLSDSGTWVWRETTAPSEYGFYYFGTSEAPSFSTPELATFIIRRLFDRAYGQN